jgi:hypothetical protein
MDDRSGAIPPSGSDLEYDLAHEAREEETQAADVPGSPAAVATGTPDYDGDYSYDLAHDVPRG